VEPPLSFSQDLANVVAEQVERFGQHRNYHLAAHVPNLDFWISQVRNALSVIDGYEFRFENLKVAQNEYIQQHQIRVPSRIDPLDFFTPDGPRRIPSHELNKARRRLVAATSRFLECLVREQFITGHRMREISLGLGIDSEF
jgi:hypothetical protein